MPRLEFRTFNGMTKMSIDGSPWETVTLDWETDNNKCKIKGSFFEPMSLELQWETEKDMQDYRDYVEPDATVPEIKFDDLPNILGLELRDISCEEYREYDFGDRVYRINNPIGLYYRAGGSTHRIVDSHGTSHLAPFPGEHTVIRWLNWDPSVPVNF